MDEVLFLGLSAAGHGGIQGFNRRVIAGLGALGVRAHVHMLHDRGDEPRGLGADRAAAGRGRGIRATLAAHVGVLLLGHVNLLPLAALWRMLHPGGRVILFAHGIEVWGDPAYRAVRWWEPALLRRVVDRVAVVSGYSQGRMARAFGLPAAGFTIFPNAVDIGAAPARGVPGRTILCVTRLGVGERAKHVDALVRALPQLPGARLVVIGEGPLKAELGVLAAALGVGDRVDLPGAVDRAALDAAYRAGAVFALPSSKEGFGIVYLEAWAAGLPVVGSRFGAAGEVIDDGVDGYTIDPEDGASLTGALRILLDDPARAAAMGAAGLAKVTARYSDAAFVANLGALLTDGRRRTLRWPSRRRTLPTSSTKGKVRQK